MENRSEMPRGRGRALRLTFSFEGAKIDLVDQQPTEKLVQPSAPLMERGKGDDKGSRGQAGREPSPADARKSAQSGFWVEVHARGGRALYRHIMSNPIQFRAEAPGEGGGFTNVTVPNPRGVFFVVVPDLPEAESVVIYSSPLGPDAKPAAAEPVARFPLRPRDPQTGKEG